MSDEDERGRWRKQVRAKIDEFGHFVTLVQGASTPRFAYTLGLSEVAGHELVLAGANTLLADGVMHVVDRAASAAREGGHDSGSVLDVVGVGSFRLAPVHPSWNEEMLLGAFTLYGSSGTPAMQLIPEGELRTIDVPDMSLPWDPEREPIWRWMHEPWPFDIAPDSVAVTNVEALRGALITEAARWEEGQWEVFAGAGPEVAPDDVRAVPIATLLGYDASLEPVTRLEVGQAMRRDPPRPWEPWGE